jgi:hypothetical protein
VAASSVVPLSSTVEVGIVALRNGGTGRTRATVSNVALTDPSAPAWTNADVGLVGSPGSFTATGGAFTVRGAGTDIWGTADAFHFVYRPWTGNGTLIARLASLTNASGASFSLGAITFRESLAANARHASMMVTTQGKAKFRRRTTTGGDTASSGPVAGTSLPPRWLKLVRSGATFSAFLSTDGTTWTAVASPASIALPQSVYVGMLVLRNGGSALATGTFTNVTVTP